MSNNGSKLFVKIVSILAVLSFITVIPAGYSDAEPSAISTIYDSLTDTQKNAYDALDVAVKNNTDSADISYLPIPDGETVREAYAYDHPEVFWFYDNFALYVYTEEGKCSKFKYSPTYTPEQIESMKTQIQSALSSLNVNTGDPEYKRLLAIHDWLCEHITYTDDTGHEGDIYGAIVEGKCVCQGYTMAFTYLCHLNDFKCVGITGYTYQSSTVGHAWNLVFGEGNWYFVDVTWDDDKRYSREDYFMVGSQTKIHGRVFATEDHIADSLYGIVPSESKFKMPVDNILTWAIIGVVVFAVLAFIIIKVRSSKRRKQLLAYGDFVLTNNSGVGSNCPACGAKIDDTCDFCPHCGQIMKKDEQIIEEKR